MINYHWYTQSLIQKKLISIAHVLRCVIAQLAIPPNVKVFILIEVEGCGWPKSNRVLRQRTTSCPFLKNATISASVTEAIIWRSMWDTVKTGLLYFGALVWFLVGSSGSPLR